MTKSRRKIAGVVGAAAIWSVGIVGGAAAQISDPEQGKSWFFLQKIAKDIEELDRCMSIVAADTDPSAISIALKPYRAALNKKSELFVDEADAYVQHYAARLVNDDMLRAFRFRVWKIALDVGRRTARSINQLTRLSCNAALDGRF